LVDELRRLAAAPRSSELPRFVWRAVGYLMLHPEAVSLVVPLFGEADASAEQRALVLDLLASAQHAQAQRGLLELLGSDAARGDRLYPLYLSRLSVLTQPTPDTVAFAEQLYDAGGGDARTAATYTLGSFAGRLADREPERARQLADKLVEGLHAADSPEQQSHYLRGLGNAGLADELAAVAPFAGSDSAQVRSAVAAALRKTQSADSEAILFDLLEDQDAAVQQSSLSTLADYRLSAAHLQRVGRSVASARVNERSFDKVLQVLGAYGDEQPSAVATAVDSLIARGIGDPQVRARAYALRQRVGN
jgi:hypothetical protein